MTLLLLGSVSDIIIFYQIQLVFSFHMHDRNVFLREEINVREHRRDSRFGYIKLSKSHHITSY